MATNSADSFVGKTTAQVPHLVNMLHAKEASMHVDNPTSVSCFYPQSSLELACDIYVFLAHMQEAQTSSPDSSVDETARTPLPDTVRKSHAKKAFTNSGIHITVSDHP